MLDRWGLDWDSVAKTNPRVISIAMSGMGVGGPWSSYVTYAPTVHALAGLTYLTSVPGRNDIGIGFSYNDHMAGLHAAIALLAALEARRATGRGQRIDMSQFEVGVGFSGPALLDWFANGVAAEPLANDPPWRIAAPHNIYRCRGHDRWIAVAVETDEQWACPPRRCSASRAGRATVSSTRRRAAGQAAPSSTANSQAGPAARTTTS